MIEKIINFIVDVVVFYIIAITKVFVELVVLLFTYFSVRK